jgi:hypothetical protein
MPITPSPHHGEGAPATAISTDRLEWSPIPDGVRITGSAKALVIRGLRWAIMALDLAAYDVAEGSYRGRPLPEYLRHRTDKACAVKARADVELAVVEVLVAELVSPFAVYARIADR